MSKTLTVAVLLAGLCAALLTAGCSSGQPSPTPAPTVTESVLFVVVTATSQPVLEATQVLEPTITPLATFTPAGYMSPTATTAATATVRKTTAPAVVTSESTPRPIATARPKATNPPPGPSLYPAPEIVGPGAGTIINDGNAIQLQFRSVGPLPSDACYYVTVTFTNPNANPGSAWNPWAFNCGDQSPPGTKLTMNVTRFPGDAYNYIYMRDTAERLAIADYLTVTWMVAIGKRDGTLLGPISSGAPLRFQPR